MTPRYNGRVNRARLLCSALAFACAVSALSGCAAATPPPGWVQGGAPLYPPHAMWMHAGSTIELLQDGRVIVNGRESFAIDAVGRVMDPEAQPVALLRPDGRLIGAGNEDLGSVGPTAAALPGATYASLAIAPSGQVIRYAPDGDMAPLGAWTGCGTYVMTLQACMLVTLLVATKYQPTRPINRYPNTPYGTPYGSSVMPGYGLGLGIP